MSPMAATQKPTDKTVFRTGFNALKITRFGPMLFNVFDPFVGKSIDLYGEYNQGAHRLYAQLVRPGDNILDVGALNGYDTVFFAKLVGSAGKVYAFESQRTMYQMMCANVAMNSLDNVQTENTAISKMTGPAFLPYVDYNIPTNFSAIKLISPVNARDDDTPVMMKSLDYVVDEAKIKTCHLLKIKIPHNAIDALKGARDLINNQQPFIYINNNDEEHSPELIEFLLKHNYELRWHLTSYFNPENFYENKENAFKGGVHINIIALPKGHNKPVDALPEVAGPDDNWKRLIEQPSEESE